MNTMLRTFLLLLPAMLSLSCTTGPGPASSGPNIKAVRGEEFPRVFTRGITSAGDWSQLAPLFDQLEAQIKEVKSPEELNAWLLRRSELASVIDEEGTRRNIAYTCHTDHPAAEKANLEFIEKINPPLKEENDRLNRLYLACPARQQADRKRLEVLDRTLENTVRLFRQENVPLQTEDDKLAQEYMKINGAITVQWQGAEKAQDMMAVYLRSTDRKIREDTWKLVWGVACRRRPGSTRSTTN
jgi:oligoendopeptidase F